MEKKKDKKSAMIYISLIISDLKDLLSAKVNLNCIFFNDIKERIRLATAISESKISLMLLNPESIINIKMMNRQI